MRVLCDNCGAVYQIPDAKLTKPVNKATCKKCQYRMLIPGPTTAPDSEAQTVITTVPKPVAPKVSKIPIIPAVPTAAASTPVYTSAPVATATNVGNAKLILACLASGLAGALITAVIMWGTPDEDATVNAPVATVAAEVAPIITEDVAEETDSPVEPAPEKVAKEKPPVKETPKKTVASKSADPAPKKTTTAAKSTAKTTPAPAPKPTPAPVKTVTTTPEPVKSNALEKVPRTLVATILTNSVEIKRCFYNHYKETGEKPPPFAIQFVVASSGVVPVAYITTPSLKGKSIDACISSTIKKLQFPPISAASDMINYTFVLN